MIDLRYLRPGDIVRVERGDTFMYAVVQSVQPGGSERFPEREILMLPCVTPGTPYPEIATWNACQRREVTGMWRADAQTRRRHPAGADAYAEWADQANRPPNERSS